MEKQKAAEEAKAAKKAAEEKELADAQKAREERAAKFKAEMDRISLQFDLHNVCDGNEELKPMCSLFSYPIINSKSR